MYLKILRPINLIIIALTQYLIYHKLILQGLINEGLQPRFNLVNLYLLIFATICIAASGYIINDILDSKTDDINKPDKRYINNGMSPEAGKIYYWTIVIAGFLASLYIGIEVDIITLIWIYPLSILILYVYSKKLKFTSLGGNIVVALFTAFVPTILLITQEGNLKFSDLGFTSIVLAFATFSFFINLSREIVKDIEDVEGDTKSNYHSLAIDYGIERAKTVASINTLFLAILLVIWLIGIQFYNEFRLASFAFIFLLAPILLVIFRLKSARLKNDYSKISNLLKYIMFAGLIFILIFGKTL